MARTTINVDEVLLAEAREVLGTIGVTETINAAMADVSRRAALAGFSVTEFDITDEDLAEARRDRAVLRG